MNFVVNMLTEEDLQQSRSKLSPMALLGVIAASLVVLYLFGFTTVKAVVARSELGVTRSRWSKVESEFKQLKTAHRDVMQLNATMAKLDTWKQARVSVAPMLEALQTVVPESMQLTRLALRSSYDLEKQKTKAAGQKDPPHKLSRTYMLSLSGTAVGERADQAATGFVDQLKTDVLDPEAFPSAVLQRLQKDTSSSELAVSFSIEAQSNRRDL